MFYQEALTASNTQRILPTESLVRPSFDGLMAFTEATQIWGLNESTLRKAIAYGKFVNGVDACKYGRQWVVSIEAMKREYGQPVEK